MTASVQLILAAVRSPNNLCKFGVPLGHPILWGPVRGKLLVAATMVQAELDVVTDDAFPARPVVIFGEDIFLGLAHHACKGPRCKNGNGAIDALITSHACEAHDAMCAKRLHPKELQNCAVVLRCARMCNMVRDAL